jgi:hypothetical protein
MKVSEVVKQVIHLAEAIYEYWETELPKRHPDYPLVHEGEVEGPPPPQEAELRTLLMKLPAKMLYELLLIMHLGRGSRFDPRDVVGGFAEMKDRFPTRKWGVEFLVQQVLLGDYLTQGLAKLSAHNISVDKMRPRPAKPRK